MRSASVWRLGRPGPSDARRLLRSGEKRGNAPRRWMLYATLIRWERKEGAPAKERESAERLVIGSAVYYIFTTFLQLLRRRLMIGSDVTTLTMFL